MENWPRREAHAIFWKLHTSYLTNNRKDAAKYLGMLSDYKDETIRQEITDIHFNRFTLIRENVKNDNFGRLYGHGFNTPEFSTTFAPIEKSCEEKQFAKQLMTKEGRLKLASILGLSENCSIVNELELGEYGRLDFLIKDGRKYIAAELKVGKAPSSLVSQIDRYRLALELEMNFGLHDEVNACVIAEQFTTYEATELSRLAVQMIEHKGTIESLKLL